MHSRKEVLSVVLVFVALLSPAFGKKHFLGSSRPHGSVGSLHDELHDAVAAALGDGHDMERDRLLATHRAIQPMWTSLPKIAHGRIDGKMLRYAVHRYFMQAYSLSIVGLEPVHGNGSHSEVKLLAEMASDYVKVVLEGKGAREGFSVEDIVGMIAALERLILDSGSDLLDSAYRAALKSPTVAVSRSEVLQIFDSWMLRWMVGDDEESIEIFEGNRTMLRESIEHWDEISEFLDGHVTSFQHAWKFQPKRPNGFRQEFSFDDVAVMANGIATSFGKYWETECANIKKSLLQMDKDHTGRAKLSDFYSTALGGEWRFSESKDYLRELGALDESSEWHGPRVIIPNYLQGASNCIISQPHYRVCCANECEDFLAELEATLGSSYASADVLISLVRNMSGTLDDETPELDPLKAQLYQIAEMHNGIVPLHGRLFAQWMHYAFPRECAFPHMAGTIKHSTPTDFGEEYLATDKDMEHHVAEGSKPQPEPLDELEKHWMSQWNDEEDLISSDVSLKAPWEKKQVGGVLVVLLGVAVIAYVWNSLQVCQAGQAGSCAGSLDDRKCHLI